MATTHQVVSGNTASQIASQYGTTVAGLQTANPQYGQFVSNPNYIQAGWNLNIPGATTSPTTTTPTTTYYQPAVTSGGNIGGDTSSTIPQSTYTPPPQALSGQAGTSSQSSQPTYTQPGGQQGSYINPQTQQSFPMGTASQGYTAQGQPIAPAPQGGQQGVQGGQGDQWAAPITGTATPEKIAAASGTRRVINGQEYIYIHKPGAASGWMTVPQWEAEQKGMVGTPTGLNLPSILTKEGAIDLTASQAGIDKIKDLMKSPQTKQTQSQMLEYLENSKNTLLQALQDAQPLPPEPMLKPEAIAEDQATLDKLQQFEQEQYESIQRSLGIPQTITDYENAIKELQATDQAFNAIIENVNSDPDFPKGLARTRIAAIQKEKGVRMNALQNKIGLLQTSLEMKKEEFADRMGITQRAISRQADQQEEAKQDAQRQVQMLISSEGIETMSDAELSQLAQAAGYTLSSLRKIRDAVKSQSQAKITKAQNDLIKQQETMALAAQREARLAGGDETTDDTTTVDDDKITVNPDGSITVGGVEIPASGETTDKAGFNLFNPSTWLNFLK